MKMKPFAMLAISSLVGVTLAYVTPAVADDAANGQAMQAPTDTQMPNSSMPMPSNNDNANANSNNNNNNNDDNGTPDTATGDDDY